MIDHATIERINEATRIEEVIGDFVSLKKRGANHIGCCPFHNEKTPSFYVSPAKGIYKCFGCGKAGDAVTFLKEHEHYSYVEALQYLARKYNIEIEEQEMTEEQKQLQTERDGLFHVSEFAQKYFADLLYNNEMGRAVGLSYFHQRGMSDEIIKRFGLGYCLDEWANFTDHALQSGYSMEALVKSGLTIEKEDTGKHYDRFRGRVMFPIFSISGRVLGFSGRILSSEKQAAKYVNSPDSEIYNKSRILYGLFQARSAIARSGKCYLVEGNVDVVSMHQSGVENTVASCGTSLTIEQVRLIKRYTPNVTVLYDGDSAGIKAALRAVNLLFSEGMHVRVVLFPDGEDPDSYAQKYGSTQLQTYLAEHEENFVMFKTRVLMDEARRDPIRKAALVKETVDTIALVPDMIERSEYVRQCAQLMGMDEEMLNAELGKAINRDRQRAYEQQRKEERASQPAAAPSPAAEGVADASAQPTQPSASASAPAPSFVPPNLPLPPDLCESRLVSLLLNYGSQYLLFDTTDEDGNPTKQRATVAEAIVSDLEADELRFADSNCQQIYDFFRQAVAERREADVAELLSSASEELRRYAISQMIDPYRISESWARKGIFVPRVEDNLLTSITEALSTFKIKCIDRMIDDNTQHFRQAKEYAEIQQLLQQKNALLAVRRKLGTMLHRVIS